MQFYVKTMDCNNILFIINYDILIVVCQDSYVNYDVVATSVELCNSSSATEQPHGLLVKTDAEG